MTSSSENYHQMMQDQLILLEALHDILNTSDEAETVRTAIMALTQTQAGLHYLVANPIIL